MWLCHVTRGAPVHQAQQEVQDGQSQVAVRRRVGQGGGQEVDERELTAQRDGELPTGLFPDDDLPRAPRLHCSLDVWNQCVKVLHA